MKRKGGKSKSKDWKKEERDQIISLYVINVDWGEKQQNMTKHDANNFNIMTVYALLYSTPFICFPSRSLLFVTTTIIDHTFNLYSDIHINLIPLFFLCADQPTNEYHRKDLVWSSIFSSPSFNTDRCPMRLSAYLRPCHY